MLWIIGGLLLCYMGLTWYKRKIKFTWLQNNMPKFAWLAFLIITLIEPIFANYFSIDIMPRSYLESIIANGFEGGCFYIGLQVNKVLG